MIDLPSAALIGLADLCTIPLAPLTFAVRCGSTGGLPCAYRIPAPGSR